MDNLVIQQNNQPITTSRMVARKFNKRHSHVLRDIERIVKHSSTLSPKLGSVEFGRLNFAPSSYKDSTGRTLTEYHITKNGFSVLAMGFTGKKALEFKIAIMNEFDKLQEEINQLKNDAEIQKLKDERNELIFQQKLNGLPMQYGKMFMHDEGKTFTLRQAMKIVVPSKVKISYEDFLHELAVKHIVWDEEPLEDYIKDGCFTYSCTKKLAYGEYVINHRTRVTPIGLVTIAVKLGYISDNTFRKDILEKYRAGELTYEDCKDDFISNFTDEKVKSFKESKINQLTK